MLARDVMTTNAVTISPGTPVAEIAKLLIERRISAVPVVDAEGRVLGIVSEGDLMRRPESESEPHHSWWLRLFESPEEHAAEYAKTHGLRAEDVMTREVVSVAEDRPVGEIAELLEERRIKRVPVTRDGRLVGIVSRADLLRALAAASSLAPPPPPADDQALRERILETLERELGPSTRFIGVTVTDGSAHVWGSAESAEEKRAIRVAVENTPGVKAVLDHIGILPPNVRSVFWAE